MTEESFVRFLKLHVLLILLLVLAVAAVEAQESPLENFDVYVEQARQAWEVPGIAIAIVKDDSVVFANGYGVRKLGGTEKVDIHTLFSIGSTTKAFTSASLALLVDEGKLDWDAPVIDYLPDFRVADSYVTRQLTIRDLPTHRTGVETTDMLWVAGYSRDEIVKRLRYAKQTSSFRSQWGYNNNMYVVAGRIIETISGTSWEHFVRERFLIPLGMHETLMLSKDIENHTNVGMAHEEIDDTLRVLPYPYIDDAGPAGSMQSNVSDMSKWVSFLLDSTRLGSQRLLAPETYAELFRPQKLLKQPIYPAAQQANPHFFAYGLSWFLQDYRGHLLAMHTGSIWGMSALVGLLPEKQLGLVVFANRDHAEVRHALMYEVFDRYIGKTDKDWSGDLIELYKGIKEKAKQSRQKREADRVSGTTFTLPLEKYTGVYADSLYGELRIYLEPSGLAMKWMGSRELIADLEHWHYDTFKTAYRDRRFGGWYVRFGINSSGTISEIELVNFKTFRRISDLPSQAEQASQ